MNRNFPIHGSQFFTATGLCEKPEDYHYSSVIFYPDALKSFRILTHFAGN